jgi:hypothetical protein
MQCGFFVRLRKMDKDSRRNIRTAATDLVKAKHLSAQGKFENRKTRTSAAKADFRSTIYGTAEAVPFQDPVLTQTL